MLDVLEDYLTACGYPCERIDGDTKQKDRQAAIDRFMASKGRSSASSSRASTPALGGTDGENSRLIAAAKQCCLFIATRCNMPVDSHSTIIAE